MKKFHSMLKETVSLLKEARCKSNTEDCVIKSLNKAIDDLESLWGEDYSEQEMNVIILEILGELFSKFPELQE